MGYQLDEVLGTGPGGDVHRASVDRPGAPDVAVRFLKLDEAGFIHLRRHAEALAGIGHDSLGLIEDVARLDDHRVLVATTLGAETLRQRTRRSPLGATEAARLIAALASALASAHRATLPHASVHAGNVVWADGRPVLIDLGLDAFRRGTFYADTDPGVWRSERHDLIDLAREIVAPLIPDPPLQARAGRAAALVELVGDNADRFVDDEMGLWSLALECERITHRPDLAPVESGEDFGRAEARPAARRHAIGAEAIAAGALVVGAVVGVTALTATRSDVVVPVAHRENPYCGARPGPRATPGPDGSEPVGRVDPNADGCLDDVWWSRSDAVLYLAVGEERRRFRLGEPGDQAVVGDWDCDGESTMGLYRPGTGETFQFDAWADHGPLTASPGPVLTPGGRAEVFDPTGDGQDCDTIALR